MLAVQALHLAVLAIAFLLQCSPVQTKDLATRDLDDDDDLHFPLRARATNKDGSTPVYKNPHAPIESRVSDLLSRMTIQEKVSQMYA
jgi:beta-glucosidase